MVTLSESQFLQNIGRSVPPSSLERVLDVFRQFGHNLSGDVAIIVAYACRKEQAVLDHVLELLEDYYKSQLQYEDPAVRGRVIAFKRGEIITLKPHPSQKVFDIIRQKVLGEPSMLSS